MQPGQANYSGHLLGGELMRLVDTVAFIAATRHARQPLVTAAVRIGDLIYIGGEVTKTGGRSLTVRTELTVDAGLQHGVTADLWRSRFGAHRGSARRAVIALSELPAE